MARVLLAEDDVEVAPDESRERELGLHLGDLHPKVRVLSPQGEKRRREKGEGRGLERGQPGPGDRRDRAPARQLHEQTQPPDVQHAALDPSDALTGHRQLYVLDLMIGFVRDLAM
ncbi:MAG: hypothetical protein ACLGIA_11425 [Actinomycetes bacterium]